MTRIRLGACNSQLPQHRCEPLREERLTRWSPTLAAWRKFPDSDAGRDSKQNMVILLSWRGRLEHRKQRLLDFTEQNTERTVGHRQSGRNPYRGSLESLAEYWVDMWRRDSRSWQSMTAKGRTNAGTVIQTIPKVPKSWEMLKFQPMSEETSLNQPWKGQILVIELN